MRISGKKTGAALAGLAIVIFSVSFALAGPGGFGHGMSGKGRGGGYGMGAGSGGGAGWGPGNCLYSGSLSPEQTKGAQTLREAHLKEIAPLQSQLFTKRLELRNLWSQANPDKGAIMAKQAEIRELEGQLQDKNTQYNLEMRALVGNK